MCYFSQLYYDSRQNIMFDEDGDIVYNIFDFIKPNDLFLFKHHKKNIITYGRYGQMVEIVYGRYFVNLKEAEDMYNGR